MAGETFLKEDPCAEVWAPETTGGLLEQERTVPVGK